MAGISHARCGVCGDSIDGGRALCVPCGKKEWRERKRELQQCYLATSAADEIAGAALEAFNQSEAFIKMKKMRDVQQQLLEYDLALSRRRVAELKSYLDSLREKNASSASLIRKKRNFLQQRKDKLKAAGQALQNSQQVITRIDDAIQLWSEKVLRPCYDITRVHQNLAKELEEWYKLSPFKRMADTSIICNVVLQDNGSYHGVDPTALTSALEHVLNIVSILCQVLDVDLSIHWRLLGTHSAIWRVDKNSSDVAPVERKLFFDSQNIDYAGVELVENAVCELCAHEGIDIVGDDVRRLLPNLISLLAKMKTSATRYYVTQFEAECKTNDAYSVFSTLTPSPSAPLFMDVVDLTRIKGLEGGHGCAIRVAAVDKDVVFRARSVMWTNLCGDKPIPADESIQTTEMYQRTLLLPGAASVSPSRIAAEVEEAFAACVQNDHGMSRPPFTWRPLVRFSFIAPGSNPYLTLLSRNERALRSIVSQMKFRLERYGGISTTKIFSIPSASAPSSSSKSRRNSGASDRDNTSASPKQPDGGQGIEVRTRTRSVPSKTRNRPVGI